METETELKEEIRELQVIIAQFKSYVPLPDGGRNTDIWSR